MRQSGGPCAPQQTNGTARSSGASPDLRVTTLQVRRATTLEGRMQVPTLPKNGRARRSLRRCPPSVLVPQLGGRACRTAPQSRHAVLGSPPDRSSVTTRRAVCAQIRPKKRRTVHRWPARTKSGGTRRAGRVRVAGGATRTGDTTWRGRRAFPGRSEITPMRRQDCGTSPGSAPGRR